VKFRVWITSYPGSYSDVEAPSFDVAMRLGAREQRASYGSTVEINAQERARVVPPWPEEGPCGPIFSRLVRINAQGGIEQ
jgi:hypothetical protein